MADDIERKIRELPEELRLRVLDYLEFLSEKYLKKGKTKGGFRFDWEGGLAELKDKYTSVELQHKSLEWR